MVNVCNKLLPLHCLFTYFWHHVCKAATYEGFQDVQTQFSFLFFKISSLARHKCSNVAVISWNPLEVKTSEKSHRKKLHKPKSSCYGGCDMSLEQFLRLSQWNVQCLAIFPHFLKQLMRIISLKQSQHMLQPGRTWIVCYILTPTLLPTHKSNNNNFQS